MLHGDNTRTSFYLRQKQFFESGPAVFERKNAAPGGQLYRTIDALRGKLQRKNWVASLCAELAVVIITMTVRGPS